MASVLNEIVSSDSEEELSKMMKRTPVGSELYSIPSNVVIPQPKPNGGFDIADFECSLCFRLLCKPVSTPCGHTYCKQCLFSGLKFRLNCPLCRTKLESPSRYKYSINIVLLNIIEKYFPEEYALREQEEQEELEEEEQSEGSKKPENEEWIYTPWSICLPSVRATCSVLLSCST